MNPSTQKPYFGQLLEYYRHEHGLTQSNLRGLLVQSGYPISAGLISKYERGINRPSPRFIFLATVCMKLSKDQTNALVEAALADTNLEFFREFASAVKGEEGPSRKSHQTRMSPKGPHTHASEKSTTQPPLKIFLCHSSGDKPSVRKLYQRLLNEEFDPWLDEENLLPGQDWSSEIEKAVRAVDIVIVCLSRTSISKAGYVQKEIKYALDFADTKPENTIFIIPLRLEECDVPERLKRWQYVNFYEKRGYERLRLALRARAKVSGNAK